MNSVTDPTLLHKTRHLGDNPAELDKFLKKLSETADDNAINRVISLYDKTIKKHELDIWKDASGIEKISQYQNAFKVLEKLYQLKTRDDRYNFKIVIPVADRPQHLDHCLKSLLALCKSYEYGGISNTDTYQKVSVIIADDSKHKNNIDQHIKLCDRLNKDGISTEYFGLQDQIRLVKQYSSSSTDLKQIISSAEKLKDIYEFSHKGASIMRNISYLKLSQQIRQLDNTLIYFIDSDQEFCVNSTHAEQNIFAINYFHYLNEIFKTQDISILTGKVVGDPPVSPAVMAGNFQQDVHNFIDTVKEMDPDKKCQFHKHQCNNTDDAAYHDMANLFGFSKTNQKFDYHCTLTGQHDNSDCFSDFSEKLGHFFYGEHPTRKTFFEYGTGFTDTKPARTVYTGNYVIKPENLKYFIPFATLKLRMAGPVLGRILKTQLKNRFVSANLPMLHNRTVDSIGQSEYRAGVKSDKHNIDLGNEFIRQFYGDVMLFSIVEISQGGMALTDLKQDDIHAIVERTYDTIKQNYVEKHFTILSLRSRIMQLVSNPDCWWNLNKHNRLKHKETLDNILSFLDNIQKNFDDKTPAYLEITSSDKTDRDLSSITDAIYHYKNNLNNWTEVLKNI